MTQAILLSGSHFLMSFVEESLKENLEQSRKENLNKKFSSCSISRNQFLFLSLSWDFFLLIAKCIGAINVYIMLNGLRRWSERGESKRPSGAFLKIKFISTLQLYAITVTPPLLKKLALTLMDFTNLPSFCSKWKMIKISWACSSWYKRDSFELFDVKAEVKSVSGNINQNLADIRRTHVDTLFNTRWAHDDDVSMISLRLRFINEEKQCLGMVCCRWERQIWLMIRKP